MNAQEFENKSSSRFSRDVREMGFQSLKQRQNHEDEDIDADASDTIKEKVRTRAREERASEIRRQLEGDFSDEYVPDDIEDLYPDEEFEDDKF